MLDPCLYLRFAISRVFEAKKKFEYRSSEHFIVQLRLSIVEANEYKQNQMQNN